MMKTLKTIAAALLALAMALTDRIVREKRLTAVMVTHNLRYAAEYGDRILMLDRGRIVLDRAGQEKRDTSAEELFQLFSRAALDCG